MKLLNRHTDYAASALSCIGRRDGAVSASEICGELGMPRAFIRGVLQKLTSAGVLQSVRGKGGGFTLARSAAKISLLEIMNIFQDTLSADGCVFRRKACPRRSRCALRMSLAKIGSAVSRELSSITIADLMKESPS